jgi:hypothetical protein
MQAIISQNICLINSKTFNTGHGGIPTGGYLKTHLAGSHHLVRRVENNPPETHPEHRKGFIGKLYTLGGLGYDGVSAFHFDSIHVACSLVPETESKFYSSNKALLTNL